MNVLTEIWCPGSRRPHVPAGIRPEGDADLHRPDPCNAESVHVMRAVWPLNAGAHALADQLVLEIMREIYARRIWQSTWQAGSSAEAH
jgi:hypothetical protein